MPVIQEFEASLHRFSHARYGQWRTVDLHNHSPASHDFGGNKDTALDDAVAHLIRNSKAGKREYVQVLRLLETFRLEEVEGAVGDALRLGAIGFDAVKHLVLCRIERRPPRLNLDVYPYLPRARVATTSAKSYMSLLPGLRA